MHPVYNAFVYIVWFFATYFTVFFALSLFTYSGKVFDKPGKMRRRPTVTFLVPAYNEEADIARTIKSLKKITYEKADFIILNDGSTDKTASIVRKNIKDDTRFSFTDNKANQGKAAVLNQGIALAKGEFIAGMDADSVVEPNILDKVLPYFQDKEVGAVTVSVKVKDPKGLLQRIFALEFALGLSLFLKIYSFFDCIFVTPGPFSIYRKKAMVELGGYDTKSITEDHEIAYRLHKNHYKIRNCIDAKVETVLPTTFKGLYIQRRRWYTGAIQAIVKHRDMLFSSKYNLFGYFTPYNFGLIMVGLCLFYSSTYLLLSKLVENILYYRYTGFNFLDHFKLDLDLLAYGRINILGVSLFVATVLLMLCAIKFTRQRYRDHKVGLFGYPFLFFLYQIYWAGAFINVVLGRKVKWR